MRQDGLGDYETCSMCVEEVFWTDLIETGLGNVCPKCNWSWVRDMLKGA